MRLINADALIDKYQSECSVDVFRYEVIEDLRNAPTVDAVPVIRCKDCKHWDGCFCHNKWWGDDYGNYTPPIKEKDGFCDWAERKDI